MRISRDDALMQIAHIMAERSTCNRLHVGAVIAREGRIIATGFNGAPSGLPHCTPENCNEHNPCTNTTHAEAGAIAHSARHGVALERTTLYVTHQPCLTCAQLLINSGVAKVVYATPYRIQDGLNLLLQAGLEVSQHGS